MEEGRTTEEVFAGLSPEAREEAVRLAARLQMKGEESAELVAAAREAGIEDRFLHEAAARVRTDHVSPTIQEPLERQLSLAIPVVPAVIIGLFVIAQGYAGLATHRELAGTDFWPSYLLAAALAWAVPRPRPRWTAPAVVAAVWVVVLAINHVTALSPSSPLRIHPNEILGLRTAAIEMLFACLGAVAAGYLSDTDRSRGVVASTPR